MTSRLLLLLAIITFSSYGQQGNIWYFGGGAGLDFNSGSPVPIFDGQVNTVEGVATLADENGDLLFYTDGMTIWNKNHDTMPNGTGLLGDTSSTQSGIIVPKPGSSTLFYVFTVAVAGSPLGVHYSEVDITLDGGLGDVNANKNIQILPNCTEQITAVVHANGTDIWVITHGYGNDVFSAFLITSAGVTTTQVNSTVGLPLDPFNSSDAIGYLKASPTGENLGMCNAGTGTQLF